MKRSLDICLATTGLLVCLPLMLLIAALIKLEDDGPILFYQFRLGQYKRPFVIYKFRSMRDNQVTDIGYWLRRTGLDELPQLLNILQGTMSLVGPRPLTYADVCRLGWDRRHYLSRWHIKPGITGLAQLHAGHGARYSWQCDKAYLAQESLRLDLTIMLLSALMCVFGKRRVRQWIKRDLNTGREKTSRLDPHRLNVTVQSERG